MTVLVVEEKNYNKMRVAFIIIRFIFAYPVCYILYERRKQPGHKIVTSSRRLSPVRRLI